jgi:hypothetical protein
MKKTKEIKKGSVELKEGMKLLGKKIDKIIDWKLYYDTQDKMVCGRYLQEVKANMLLVAKPEELLPTYINQPQWVEERKAILIILK